MPGVLELARLLAGAEPVLDDFDYVFVSIPGAGYGDYHALKPVASFREREGLSLVLERTAAEDAGLRFDSVFRKISLGVHSSLDAVGLSAAVTGKLADAGISCNLVAGYYHDHLFVPAERAEESLRLLSRL